MSISTGHADDDEGAEVDGYHCVDSSGNPSDCELVYASNFAQLLKFAKGGKKEQGRDSKGKAFYCLATVDGVERVTVVRHEVVAKGAYSVVTMEPYVVVDGVVASPFSYTHWLPNAFFAMVRVVYKVCPGCVTSPYAADNIVWLRNSLLPLYQKQFGGFHSAL